ncbi:hypothetical protein N7E02_07120 (plasmid) [Aliirhizobium terrae]|uniref:hypothetical protein n=1 Tax=Terrirhizobium terrae TaxID=2926709 RepID=UPI0025784A6E|nr:hypothetical protein [Rhizobium sp. CC-CFT758]WJH38401.1 hypothetical protein N7E02_07120 [Rhizobium sp. CC-CFT758]
MTEHINTQDIDGKSLKSVISIRDFCLAHRLTSDEQIRLIRLLGTYATKQEMSVNVQMKSKIRY